METLLYFGFLTLAQLVVFTNLLILLLFLIAGIIFYFCYWEKKLYAKAVKDANIESAQPLLSEPSAPIPEEELTAVELKKPVEPIYVKVDVEDATKTEEQKAASPHQYENLGALIPTDLPPGKSNITEHAKLPLLYENINIAPPENDPIVTAEKLTPESAYVNAPSVDIFATSDIFADVEKLATETNIKSIV